MINLMYIVLMAMLALNVSSDVLNGFTLVKDGLTRSANNSTTQNQNIFASLEQALKENPEKVRPWYDKAVYVKQMSDSLCNYAEQLKLQIVRYADGSDADLSDIRNRDNTEAASHVMLAEGIGQGRELYDAINQYRDKVVSMVVDPTQKDIIADNFSTEVPRRAGLIGKNWQEAMFEDMPVAAAVTLLTKLQNDVRFAESEILHQLVSNIDVKDVRVNQISAFVIPNAHTVVRGGKFSAQIVMAAIDTTQRPDIYIGNTLLKNSRGLYETVCNSTGDFTLRGYLTMPNGNGDVIRREFEQKYTVVEPSATVSATMMNVLYAGYQNPISVGVPGVPINRIAASMTGGTLTKRADGQYIAVPSATSGDVTITITAQNEGRAQEMGKFNFHVRKLPDPSAYILLTDAKGETTRYKGGRPVAKASLVSAKGVSAAIDDGLLDIPFQVTSFETVFTDNLGNSVVEKSAGASFSDRQMDMFRRIQRGRRFIISRVHATGPDGVDRTLPYAMEIIVN